jgi:hypothetical protein
MSIGFTAARNDSETIELKIYSSSQRLIRLIKKSGTEAAAIMSASRFNVNSSDLLGLSNGTYYYVITASKPGDTARSRIDKFIIIR